jgi:FkbM family methyltransferase
MIDALIDCGANLGQGYERIIRYLNYTPKTVYMFDILPNACKVLKERYQNAIVFQKGVWCASETRIVKQENAHIDNIENVGHESNILEDNHKKTESGLAATWNTYEIDCINLSDFLKNTFLRNENIFLKLDIEGCEYEVLDKLIADNTINLINTLHVEWHPHLRNDQTKDISYYEILLKEKGINILTGEHF